MRISDWSSDVCSSDLRPAGAHSCPRSLGRTRNGPYRLTTPRKGMHMGTDSGRLNTRDQKIWHDYTLGGKTLMALAEEHNVSNQRISQIIQEIREKLPPRDRQKIGRAHV